MTGGLHETEVQQYLFDHDHRRRRRPELPQRDRRRRRRERHLAHHERRAQVAQLSS